MMLRKWLARTLALSVLVLAGGGWYLVQRWTNPQMVRELALQSLGAKLPGVDVRLASAEFRLLGGVTLHDLRCAFRGTDDPDCFAVFPETVIYPDKEQLTRGKLGLRKVVFRRPNLSLVRQPDGALNLEQLRLAAGAGEIGALPLVQIEDASLTLHDQACAAPPLHLTQLQLELTPLDSCRYRVVGSALLDLLGPCRCYGQVNVQSGEAQLTLTLPELMLAEELFDRLQLHWPDWKKLELELGGQLALQVQLTHAPGAAPPLSCSVTGELRQGRAVHPQLPGVAAELAGRFAYVSRQLTVEKLTGRFLGGQFELSGAAAPDGRLHAKIEGKRWQVEPALYNRLPPGIRRLCVEYQPVGRLSGSAEVTCEGGRLGFSYAVHPEGLSVLFDDLPYPVHDVQGNIHYHEPNGEPQMTMHLAGKGSGQPVQLRGRLFGAGLRPDNDLKCGFDLELCAENIPVDETLLKGLAPYPFTARTLAQFHASGKFACRAKLDRVAGTEPGVRPPLRKEIAIHVDEAKFKFDEFPYPLEQGQATLTVHTDNSWSFDNLSATRLGGWVFGKGKMIPTAQGDQLSVQLRAVNLPLDAELKAAVPQEAKDAWDELRPAGRVDGEIDLSLLVGHGPPKIDLTVRPRGCSLKPLFFPYLLTEVAGQARYRDHALALQRLSAKHGEGKLFIQEGAVAFGPNDAIDAKLLPVSADGLVVDEELLDAVPKALRSALQTLQPDKPVSLCANLILRTAGKGQPWQCGWNGHVDVKACKLQAGLELSEVDGRIRLQGKHDGQRLAAWGRADLAQATILRQPFTQVGMDLTLSEDQIKLTNLTGQLHGGALKGQVDVRLLDPIQYETYVRADDVDLGRTAAHATGRSSDVKGRLSAGLALNGRGKEVRSLRGEGWLKVSEGARLCELPILLELAAHFSRLSPRATSFQDATALVAIEGEKLQINRFDLLSDAMSLRGHGQVGLDGSDLNLELFGVPYGRSLPNLPPLIERIPPTLSKQFLRIRATGALSAVQVATEPLPALLDPFKDMLKTFNEKPTTPEPAPTRPAPPFDLGPPPGLESRR